MRRTLASLCVIGLLVLSACAWASVDGPLTVTATSGDKVATWTYNWVPGVTNYQLSAPVQLMASDNTVLGSLNSLSCGMDADPVLTLNFAVQAVGNTHFTFDTGEFLFLPIDPAVAFATAAATLTADGGGATFTGNFTGGKAYKATYDVVLPFATLDSSFVSPANTSTTESERSPVVGTTPLGLPAFSMRSKWDFNLSGGDGASGTSRYEIQPAPAVPDASTLALAFAGAAPMLAGFARRRRRP